MNDKNTMPLKENKLDTKQMSSIVKKAVLLILGLLCVVACINDFLIGAIITGVIVLGMLIYYFRRKQRNTEQSQEAVKPASMEAKIDKEKRPTSNFSDKVKYEKKKQKVALLFCFDFDNTIVQEHTHNILIECPEVVSNRGQVNDEKLAKALVSKLAFKFKAENELAETFKSIYNEGHNIAVVSYHSFPLVIKEVLKNLLVKAGIPLKELKLKGEDGSGRIYINAVLPFNSPEYHLNFGKNEYIEDAVANFHMDVQDMAARSSVILIDDDTHNRELAATGNYRVIEVAADNLNYNLHLKKAREIIYNTKYEETLDSELDKIISSDENNI